MNQLTAPVLTMSCRDLMKVHALTPEIQALDTLKTERIYTDMSKFAHTYFATQVEPLNFMGIVNFTTPSHKFYEVHPKLDTPPKCLEGYNMLFSKVNPKLDLCLNLLKLFLTWAITVFLVASCGRSAYAVDLSKSLSVTPQRHCGFIVPKFCIGSQSMLKIQGTSVSATHTRLYSLYEGMTSQNKAMPNMWGGTKTLRVNPLTLISQISVISKTQNVLGGITHA